MQDQAFRLRQLVVEKRQGWLLRRPYFFRVGVYGAQPSVGATTLAQALVAFWRMAGLRAEYIRWECKEDMGATEKKDGAPCLSKAGERIFQSAGAELGTEVENGVAVNADLPRSFSGQVTEYFRPPGGFFSVSERGWHHQIRCVVTDIGACNAERERAVLGTFAVFVVVMTEDPLAVMAAYKWLKAGIDDGVPRRSVVVLNRSLDPSTGAEMSHRLQVACERFMGVSPPVVVLPKIPELGGPVLKAISADRDSDELSSTREGWTRVACPPDAANAWEKGIAGIAECVVRLGLENKFLPEELALQVVGVAASKTGRFVEKTELAGRANDLSRQEQLKAVQNG